MSMWNCSTNYIANYKSKNLKKIITLFQTFADGFNILDSSLDVDNAYPDGILKIFVILKSIAKIEKKIFFKILGFFFLTKRHDAPSFS